MKFTIKDKRFIQKSDEVIAYLIENDDIKIARSILKGLTNISKIEENITEFTYLNFKGCDCFESCCKDCAQGYLLLENKQIGAIIVREDNVNEIVEYQDILDDYGIEKIFKSGDKTLLITHSGAKYMTTKSLEDEYDIEKAVMILLLKRHGYSVNDIYTIINSVK